MTIVSGQIEPLKRLKETLHSEGIYRFNSIGEINAFMKQYEIERQAIPENVRSSVDDEIDGLRLAIEKAGEKRENNLFSKISYYFKTRRLIRRSEDLVKNYESVIEKRCCDSQRDLESIKEIIEGLYPVISGAIGESSVVSELMRLPDSYYLINDLSLKFKPPIFNRRENERIHSVQIDHLLICQSGVFIIETKNWSSKSIESLDLRSPVEQIKRANFALFVYLNGDTKRELVQHHWGAKKIPIRNIIVMTNKKPKGDFQHVKVLLLNELNGYIKYFEPVFDEDEVKGIFRYLDDESR